MSKQTIAFVIEGVEYRVSQPGAETADRILFRAGQVLSAALQRSAPESLDQATVLSFIVGLVRFMSPEDFVWLRNEMKAATEVGVEDKVGGLGKVSFVGFEKVPGGYDEHFRGRHDAMMQWLWRSAEAIFGPFAVALVARMAARRAESEAASRSSPPPVAGGSSGGSSSPSA